jgi:hypothetical protein
VGGEYLEASSMGIDEEQLRVPPLRFASVGMTVLERLLVDGGWVVEYLEASLVSLDEEQLRVPPLRFASVGMTLVDA